MESITAIIEFARQIGGTYLLGIVLIALLLDRWKYPKLLLEWWLSARERATAERAAQSETYRKEAEDQRKWRTEDNLRFRTEIDELRIRFDTEFTELQERLSARLDEAEETTKRTLDLLMGEQKNSARLRHALNNCAQYIYGLQFMLRKLDQRIPPFTGLAHFLEEGGTADEFPSTLNEHNDGG